MSRRIQFEKTVYAYDSLNRFEADDFVEAVVTSAFPTTTDENGNKQMDYDPMSKIMAIKVNIIKFYGDIDLEKINADELYDLACDIDIEKFKTDYNINAVQFDDILQAINEKCDYIKQHMVASSINSDVEDLLEITSNMKPILEMANEVFGNTDPEVMHKLITSFADNDFNLNPDDIADAVITSENFQKNRIDAIEAIKQGAAEAVKNNVVSINDRK